jgi:nucleotide-binding universal stress UspA family protein
MSYKSIVTVVARTELNVHQMNAAVRLARTWDAHLSVLCIGIERVIPDYYFAGASYAVRNDLIEAARKDALAAEAAVRDRLAAEDVRWGVDALVVQPGTLGTVIGQRTRFADLVVLTQPYGPNGGDDLVAVTEAAMFEGRAPILVIPTGGLAPGFSDRIVLAWNESDEALHAARAALPLLKAAHLVDIAVVDPRQTGPERSDPGGPLSEMLARHGVKAEVSVLAKTMPKVSEIIAQQATDKQAGLIVMGAYGHSRIREAILGGATRAMLEQAKVPVFMAH